MEPFITVVSGLPRSGTSMVMRMLENGGMDLLTDRARAADEDNPRGYFEFEPVRDLARDASWMPSARGKAVKIISHLLYHLPPGERYRIILLQRDMGEVLVSQRKMLERRGTAGDAGVDSILAEKYAAHLRNVVSWITNQKHIALLTVQYTEILADPREAAERMRDFLDLPLDTEAMAASVDPALYRNRRQ